MTEGGERARLWQRVSTGGQDEASQLPDLVNWAVTHKYVFDLAERYVVKGKSAYKGQHDKMLDQAIRDMSAGLYTVLVVWASSRIERRGAYSAFDLARRVREAGGRIEYVKDAYLNDVSEMSDVMLALAATKDRQESKDKSDRIIAKQSALRAAGSLVGRPPWGYEIQKRGGRKIIVPTTAGRQYIPLIYQMTINGSTLRDIAVWLDSEKVPTSQGGRQWHETHIGQLIRRPTYHGQRPNAGNLETEGMVSITTWQEANAALSSRVRPGRGTTKHKKPMVRPLCGACYGQKREGCPSGRSPMYRIFVRYGDGPRAMFRCTGHGPQRQGCGAPLVSVNELDAAVMGAMAANEMPHYERVFIPGDDRSDAIAKLREQGAVAMRCGDNAGVMEAMARVGELESLPRIPPHWITKDAGQNEAEFFASLSPREQRNYLARHEITVQHNADDGEIIFSIAPNWAISEH